MTPSTLGSRKMSSVDIQDVIEALLAVKKVQDEVEEQEREAEREWKAEEEWKRKAEEEERAREVNRARNTCCSSL
jgi:hypothetical protein